MARKAFNVRYNIPREEGVHVLYTVPVDWYLVVRVSSLHPRRCMHVRRVILGEVGVSVTDHDSQYTFAVEPEQSLSVDVKEYSGDRAIGFDGWLEYQGGYDDT